MKLLDFFNHLKPSFIIIGAQKAGTTALFNYLKQHQSLVASKPKEIHFFDSLDKLNYNDYHKHFPKRIFYNKKSFEATPRYLYFPGTAKRLNDYNPNLKLLVSLRDPTTRAFSAWNMYQQMKNDVKWMKTFKRSGELDKKNKIYEYLKNPNIKTFRNWIDKEIDDNKTQNILEPSILKRGHYNEQILEYLKYFPLKNMYFLDSKSLQNNTERELNNICKFLNIDSFNFNNLNFKLHHKRSYKMAISAADESFLREYYSIKNKNLEDIINVNLNW